MDWRLSTFGKNMRGLLTDPARMNALTSSAPFNMGMGLLAQNAMPGGGNPAAGLLGGLASAKGEQEANRDRIDKEEDRKMREEYQQKVAAFLQAQAQSMQPQAPGPMGGGMPPGMPQGMPPVPGLGATAPPEDSRMPPWLRASAWSMLMNRR